MYFFKTFFCFCNLVKNPNVSLRNIKTRGIKIKLWLVSQDNNFQKQKTKNEIVINGNKVIG